MSRLSIAFSAAALAFPSQAALAQDTPDGHWHGGLSVSGALASGNTSSLTLAANADASRATEEDKISLYGIANYGRNKVDGIQTTAADLLRLGGRYDFNYGPRWFAFGGAEGETNESGGVRDRYNLNGGVGYHVVKSDTHSWDVFGGLGYSDTRFTDGSQANGAQVLLGEESSHKVSETTSLRQRFVYYPHGGELDDRATFDAGLATTISGGWTLNAGLSSRYAGRVPAGTKKTDNLLTMGFGYKF
ncbi:YdiY family protein [Roseateles sp. DC23W]|uniref:YdiY family protein n=1 Tax=Pelomonas dachongensis TaxID=3299029 RepID=A0ABW7EVZ3_9BURK